MSTAHHCIAFTLVLMGLSVPAQAKTWTVEQVVKRAIAQQNLDDHLEHAKEELAAEVAQATVRTNPSIGLSYQQIFGNEAVRMIQVGLGVKHTFDVKNWRGAYRGSLKYDLAALDANKEARALQVAAIVSMAFYKVRHHQERLKAINDTITQLERGVRLVAARKKQGDVSVLALARTKRAVQIAHAQRTIEHSQLIEAWATLQTWANWKSRPKLGGALQPSAPESTSGALPPHLQALQQQQLALDNKVQAWGAPFWRGWTVSAGYMHVGMAGNHGPGVTLSLNVPLVWWDTDKPRIDALTAKRAHISGEFQLAQSMNIRAVDAATRRLTTTLDAIEKLTHTKTQNTIKLIPLAEAAYRGGELPLSELLDVYSSRSTLNLTAIDLQWEARRAAIDLAILQGRNVTP